MGLTNQPGHVLSLLKFFRLVQDVVFFLKVFSPETLRSKVLAPDDMKNAQSLEDFKSKVKILKFENCVQVIFIV